MACCRFVTIIIRHARRVDYSPNASLPKMSSRPEAKFADASEEQGLAGFFKRLDKVEDTIHIFEKGDIYICVGPDARELAQTMYRTDAVIKRISGGVEVCAMNQAKMINFVKVLLNSGRKVEIFEPKGKTNWQLQRKASVGNTSAIEDIVGSGDERAIVMAVKVSVKAETRSVGVCFLESAARQIGLAEFTDSPLYANLESFIIQIGAREVLLAEQPNNIADSNDTETEALLDVFNRCGVVVSRVDRKSFNGADVDSDVAKLLKEVDSKMIEWSEYETARGSAAAVLRYVNVFTDPSNYGTYSLVRHDLSQYMRLDSAAVRALNLFDLRNPKNTAPTTIYGLLNKCLTAGGSRLLSQWLKQPLLSVTEVRKRHEIVDTLFQNSALRDQLRLELKAVPDISKLSRKLAKAASASEDGSKSGNSSKHALDHLVRIYQLVIQLPLILELLRDTANALIDMDLCEPLDKAVTSLVRFKDMVETTVDVDSANHHEYIIRPDFDGRLQEIKQRLNEIKAEMDADHQSTGSLLGMDPDKKLKLEQHQQFGWTYRLTRTDAVVLRKHSGFQEYATQKAGVYFSSRKLRTLSVESGELEEEYRKTQSGLVGEVLSVAATYLPVLSNIDQVLAYLDVMCSFAHVAYLAPVPYVKPEMLGHDSSTRMTLRASRHPCVEMQDGVHFMPNDVTLRREESELLIITGPNMGGKSTYIRQIGVIALMAQVGSFVPCESAEIAVFDAILARVGAADSQIKGLSTFMAEMVETSAILRNATADSLVIVDELGRGTSTYDGFGLAWAIAEHLVDKIKCCTLFATHFHELTRMVSPSVKNLHVAVAEMETGENTLTLLYKVEEGPSDQSLGVHVAQVVGFPDKVVKMAKRKTAELEESEKLDEDIDHQKRRLTNETLTSLKAALRAWRDDLAASSAPTDAKDAVALLRQHIGTHAKEVLAELQ